MRILPRLFPTVIGVSVLTLTVRIGVLWHDAGAALAATEPAQAAAPAGSPTPAAQGEPPPATGDSAKPHSSPAPKFSASEVEVLTELSKRRAELDKRAEDLDHRELLLKAAEQRVDDKIAQLKDLQTQVDATVDKVKAEDDERLKSLVRIYENMKPKEAAAIFEGMEISSVLDLLTRMKDLKTAPILAAMAPDKARAVTVALEQRKGLPDSKTN
jgi:flagellar motility protein MotE (MotC chaperone)